MTYKQWEFELKHLLSGLPEKEIDAATGYYAEIYGDKKDAGFSDEDILKEFGTPEECAERIRAEANASTDPTDNSDDGKKKISITLPDKDKLAHVAMLTCFVVIPLALIAFSVIAAIVSFVVGSAGLTIGGLASVINGFINLFSGNGFLVFLSMFGLGIAGIGLGFILTVAFIYATKITLLFAYKLFKGFYVK